MHYVTLGLALLWKYYFLALENILSLVLLLLLYFILFLIFFSLLYSEISLCNLYYFCYSNNVLLIIVKFCLSKIKFTYLISHQNPKVNKIDFMLSTLYFENLIQITISFLAKLGHRGEYTRHKEIWLYD